MNPKAFIFKAIIMEAILDVRLRHGGATLYFPLGSESDRSTFSRKNPTGS